MAWIAAVVQGLGALYGAYQSSKADKKQGKITDAQGRLIDEQINASRLLQPYGMESLQEGRATLAPVLRHYALLARGDRSTAMGELAPDIERINSLNSEARRNAAELTPRGGGRSALLAGDAYRRADSISRLYSGARSDAFGKLASLGDNQSRLGLSALGASFGGLQGAASGYQGQLAGLMATRNQSNQEGQDAGAGLADAWKQFSDWYKSRK